MWYSQKEEQQFFDLLYEKIFVTSTPLYAGALLERAAHQAGQSVALLYKNKEITYQELYAQSVCLSMYLQNLGVKKGDKIALCFENSPDFYRAYFAVWQIGAVVIPLNTFLQKNEIEHILKDCMPTLGVVSSTISTYDLYKSLLSNIVTQDDFPDITITEHEKFSSITLEPDQMCTILYTSGTTGTPKGVMLSSRNIITSIIQGVSRLGLTSSERILAVLPLFHVFAQNTCIWSAFFMKCTVIVVPKIERRAVFEGIACKPSIILGVPAFFGLLCLLRLNDMEQVKYFFSGGDALPFKIRMSFELIFRRKICNGYGLSETSPMLAAQLEDTMSLANDVGKPFVGIVCQIRNDQGDILSKGQSGTLWVKGDNIMLGYYNAQQATQHVMQDGWFNTGDTAYISDGNIIITGREKDLIVHKGIKIYPQEVENIIFLHPNVMRVAVVGKADESYGEIPVAYVQLRTEDSTMPSQLKQLCLQHLAQYKVPRNFICQVNDFPLTATGKIDKKMLVK